MRFVKTENIVSGMVLGRSILNSNGNALITKGTVIKDIYVKSLRNMNVNGIYIEDSLSKDIIILDNIREEIKSKSLKKLKETFFIAEKTNMVKQSLPNMKKEIETLVGDIIEDMLLNEEFTINIIDLKIYDEYTFFHSLNVSILSIMMGINLGFNKKELSELATAAILHDIGKVFIPKNIINSPGKLNILDWNTVEKHSEMGYTFLKNVLNMSPKIYLSVLHHHEKVDGTGYPRGIKGNRIHIYSKIISIADVYDALTSNRSYRAALLPSDAIEFVLGNGGIAFDPDVVGIFYNTIYPYPNGTLVELSNGKNAIVVNNNKGLPTRPIVKTIETEYVESVVIDLSELTTTNITITGCQ